MLAIDDVLIDDDVLRTMFCCDIAQCKGACCVEGERGAPLLREEVQLLRDAVDKVGQFLPEKNIRHIKHNGCLEVYQGDIYTQTIEGLECVFAFRSDGITLCTIEARKPLSCRLFPIRIKKKFGLDYLVVERHAMCRHARKKGIERQVPLVDYVREALIEHYGLSWYSRLKDLLANSPIHYARH